MTPSERFVEEMGLISQDHGDSRISGRIVGLLIVSGEALSLSQISDRLGVSRASVSTNARTLARRGAIKLTAQAGDRQDYYVISELPYFDMLAEIARQFERHAQTVRGCALEMREADPAAARRVAAVEDFFSKSAEVLAHWADAFKSDAAPQEDQK